ncbi:hypothetical protein NDU88_001978, partial [Pleurodeles waltl]
DYSPRISGSLLSAGKEGVSSLYSRSASKYAFRIIHFNKACDVKRNMRSPRSKYLYRAYSVR